MTMCESSPWRRWLAAALLAAPLLATAQADPPARVAYISAQEGAAQLATDGRNFAPAGINWPVTNGTRIVTDPNGRTELHSGSLAIRLTRSADLSVTQLDDDTAQVALMDGSVSLRVRQLRPGERVEVDTPQLAVVVAPQWRWGQPDAVIAATYLELLAQARGIGCCWAGYLCMAFEHPAAQEVRDFLGIREGEMAFAAQMMGYPRFKAHARPPRKNAHITWK